MEVKNWSYEDFPEWTDLPEKSDRLETTGDEPGTYYVPDVEYAVMDGIPLHLQILMPLSRNHPADPHPCVVYVQGSGWMEQDCYHNVGRIAHLAERGYVVAIVQYRHSGQAGFPAQIQDARNAVRFMRVHAKEYYVNPDRIFLAGSSSGGHTAVFAALAGPDDCTEEGLVFPDSDFRLDEKYYSYPEDAFRNEGRNEEKRVCFDRNLYPGVSAGVLGVIDLYGCVSVRFEDDFPTLTPRGAEGGMDTSFLSHIPEEERRGIERRASAVCWITKETDMVPVFIIHGTKDRIVNTRQSAELYQALRASGNECEFHLLGGADHGGPEFWMPGVVELEDRFLRKVLAHSASYSSSKAPV